MKRFLLFVLFASLWLPLAIFLIYVLFLIMAQVVETPGPVQLRPWVDFAVLSPFGFPLALACRALRRGGHVVSAWITFIVLAPATVWAVLIGGLFGPLGIAIYAIVFSFPAWAVYGFFRHRAKSQPA